MNFNFNINVSINFNINFNFNSNLTRAQEGKKKEITLKVKRVDIVPDDDPVPVSFVSDRRGFNCVQVTAIVREVLQNSGREKVTLNPKPLDDWGNGSNFRPKPKEKYWEFMISICVFHCESGNSRCIVLPAATSGRSRILWASNNGKLNLLASKHLNQGIQQEMLANSSNNADTIS